MMKVKIENISEFNYIKRSGINPLLFYDNIDIDIKLRIQEQQKLFGYAILGEKEVIKANQYFYKYAWDNKPHICEECGIELYYYSATYISHILTRGSHPEIAHDIRNVNILCKRHHDKWEFGKRSKMRIYKKNKLIISILKNEYSYANKKQ